MVVQVAGIRMNCSTNGLSMLQSRESSFVYHIASKGVSGYPDAVEFDASQVGQECRSHAVGLTIGTVLVECHVPTLDFGGEKDRLRLATCLGSETLAAYRSEDVSCEPMARG